VINGNASLGCDAQPVIDGITTMFASDTTITLAFQRVAANAHEPDALNAEFRKIQACLSATEDDDTLVAERKVSIQVYPAGYALSR
jgi:hypothetical protein